VISQPAILVVDYDPTERGSLSAMLQYAGYLAATAGDGITALAQLEKKQFDIVLTDIKMPRMGGMALLREIKERKINSEVILMSSYRTPKDIVEATNAGAYGFIEKNPLNNDEELKLTIKQALKKRGFSDSELAKNR